MYILKSQENPDDRDAEARVNAVKGVVSVCERLTETENCSDSNLRKDDMPLLFLIKNEVMTSLLRSLGDYSVDNRGDVGSWVREAAMDGLERCTYILCKKNSVGSNERLDQTEIASDLREIDIVENYKFSLIFDENLSTRIIGGLCKQAVEKMDKLREAAAKVLQRILHNKMVYIPYIPHRKKLEEIVPADANLKWGVRYIGHFFIFIGQLFLF